MAPPESVAAARSKSRLQDVIVLTVNPPPPQFTACAAAFPLQAVELPLGPGGEFAFVIVAVASGEHLLAPDAAGTVLFGTALTMAIIPILVFFLLAQRRIVGGLSGLAGSLKG